MSDTKVCYVWDENLIDQCDRLPAVQGRAKLVHSLIHAYDLHNKVKVVRSAPVSYNDLRQFHSEIYLDHIKKFTAVDDEYMTNTDDEEFGIGYDCPPVSNMFELVTTLAGGSVTAAKCLIVGLAKVAINWCGGWHHAQRFGAEGFCYVNDIVIAIEMLRKKFPKVLYIDVDVHHGNGVQDAYNLSRSVFTLSFHKYEAGFYPGTGSLEDIGTLTGKGYSCNVPLQAGYCDDTFEYLFEQVFNSVYAHYSPKAIVVQCGADALSHDPNGGARLTIRGYCKCVHMVLCKNLPTILLGGGGYNSTNTARLWASLTALTVGVTLDDNIPEHDNWPQYGPDFVLNINPSLSKDNNKKSDLDQLIDTIKDNLEQYLPITPEQETQPKRKKTDTTEVKTLSYYRHNDKEISSNEHSKHSPETNDVYDFIE